VLASVFGLFFEFMDETSRTFYRWTFICIQFVLMVFATTYFYAVGYVREDGNKSYTFKKLIN